MGTYEKNAIYCPRFPASFQAVGKVRKIVMSAWMLTQQISFCLLKMRHLRESFCDCRKHSPKLRKVGLLVIVFSKLLQKASF